MFLRCRWSAFEQFVNSSFTLSIGCKTSPQGEPDQDLHGQGRGSLSDRPAQGREAGRGLGLFNLTTTTPIVNRLKGMLGRSPPQTGQS